MDTSSIDLPDEIIELILLKCSVKFVARFKSVSKSWRSSISSPYFAQHLRYRNMFSVWAKPRNNDGHRLYLIRLEDGKFEKETVSLGYPFETSVVPLCSCDGQILLRTADNKYMLWNPFITKLVIPKHICRPMQYNFYYDSTADDHKILFFHGNCYTVYSCKNTIVRWGGTFPRDLYRMDCKVLVGGCFYFKRDGGFMCFDCRDGKLHEFGLPQDVEDRAALELKAVSGRLCLYGFNKDGRELHLWVMEKNRSFEKCWRKLISMEKVKRYISNLIPVCLSCEDCVVFWAEVPHHMGKFEHFIYNPRGNSFREIEFTWEYSDQYFPHI